DADPAGGRQRTLPPAGWVARLLECEMSAELVAAIDCAVAYVRAHPDEMTRAEVDEFTQLAAHVYKLAHGAGLGSCLPQVPEFRPELESQNPPLPPVQFISKLNLSGDWYVRRSGDDVLPDPPGLCDPEPEEPVRVFLTVAPPRWYQDMATLRELAEAGQPPRGEPEAKGTPPPRLTTDLPGMAITL